MDRAICEYCLANYPATLFILEKQHNQLCDNTSPQEWRKKKTFHWQMKMPFEAAAIYIAALRGLVYPSCVRMWDLSIETLISGSIRSRRQRTTQIDCRGPVKPSWGLHQSFSYQLATQNFHKQPHNTYEQTPVPGEWRPCQSRRGRSRIGQAPILPRTGVTSKSTCGAYDDRPCNRRAQVPRPQLRLGAPA